MDYKEKYEQALSRAKQFSEKPLLEDSAGIVEYIFPELKEPELVESENERIRKEILLFLREGKPYYCPNSIKRQEWAAWLEKQSEQNSNCIRITQNIINYINKHKEKFENDIPKLGDIWNVKEICTYPCVNNGKPVVEIENNKGAWMRLPLHVAYGTFPELTESEDERMRKEIKNIFCSLGEGKIPVSINFADIFDWLEKQKAVNILDEEEREFADNVDSYRKEVDAAYQKGYNEGVRVTLEKQGKQKPTPDTRYEIKVGSSLSVNGKPFDYENATIVQKDFAPKVEPKFKVGDWIVSKTSNLVYRVDSILFPQSKCYYLSHNGGIVLVNFADEQNYRLWTIQDAEDGDVLVDEYGIYIFNSFDSLDDKLFICKCAYEYSKKVLEIGGMLCSKTGVKPPTKEQRDLLFRKMKEAGYEWNSEKKELRRIKQNSAWSEEDIEMLNSAISFVEHSAFTTIGKGKNNVVSWLKSLKDKVQPQPEQEWSEDDEKLAQAKKDAYNDALDKK